MTAHLNDYLNASSTPRERPAASVFSAATRELHTSIDAAIRRHGVPYLHPEDPTLQLDMLTGTN